MLVLGGVTGKSATSVYYDTAESYWSAERTFGGTTGWKEINPMTDARANFGACTTDDGSIVVSFTRFLKAFRYAFVMLFYTKNDFCDRS